MNERELEDGDFDYEEVKPRSGEIHIVTNQPHDEEVSLSDSEQHRPGQDILQDQHAADLDAGNEPLDGALATSRATFGVSATKHSGNTSPAPDTGETPQNTVFPYGYNAKQYEQASVDSSIQALFAYIGRYQPQRRHLETELKPFIPDYIAAVGDVDEFLKPHRPDGDPETLGLVVLDEPSAKQSDPAILRKLARSTMKGTAALADHDDFEAAIRHNDPERSEKIEAWIQSVEKLRDAQPVGEFKSSNRFPALDTLMQAWPDELEPLVRRLRISNSHIDVDVNALGEAVCNLLDIPIYNDVLESLHWVFMLYLELKNNELINPMNKMGGTDNVNFFVNDA